MTQVYIHGTLIPPVVCIDHEAMPRWIVFHHSLMQSAAFSPDPLSRHPRSWIVHTRTIQEWEERDSPPPDDSYPPIACLAQSDTVWGRSAWRVSRGAGTSPERKGRSRAPYCHLRTFELLNVASVSSFEDKERRTCTEKVREGGRGGSGSTCHVQGEECR